MKAFLYVRVSTDEQADTGYSQRYQEETLKRYCGLKGITVVDVFFEDHSAKTFLRPQWSRLLILLKKHKGIADAVLFTKWDRFSRNAGDAYGMINTLNKMAVDQQAIEQPLDLTIPENKLMLAFYLAQPEVENDRRALNVTGGMRRARKEGRWMGKAPLGYKNKTLDGKKSIVICPQQGPLMQWVFEEIAKGVHTARSIRLMARERGLVTGTGKPVCNTSFWYAIRCPAYCGYIKVPACKGEDEQLVRGHHQALISEGLWYRAQDALDGKKKVMRTKMKVDDHFPLRGYLTCPNCCKLLTASTSKGRNHRYSYYHCFNGCNVRFSQEHTHDRFARYLRRWKPHAAVGQLYRAVLQDMYREGDKVRIKELQRLRDDLNRQQEYKNKIRKLRILEELDAEDYRIEKGECDAQIVKLEESLAHLVQATDLQPQLEQAYELLVNIEDAFETRDIDWKRDFLGSMFPEKLEFDGESFRTARVNEVAELLFNMGAGFREIKMGQEKDFSSLSQFVDP